METIDKGRQDAGEFLLSEEDAADGNIPEVDRILNGCAFLRHCRDDAAKLSAPAWYAMLTIMSRVEDGREVCQMLSRNYPGYDERETDEKIRHALKDTGPLTCTTIKTKYGGQWCKGCQAEVRSPIALCGEAQKAPPPSETAAIIAHATDRATLFHDELQNPMAAVSVGEHTEVMKMGKSFESWFLRSIYTETGDVPSREAIQQALKILGAKACYDGPELKLNLRVAEFEGAFWYDLADKDWRAIQITPESWHIADKPPLIFRRYSNTAPQVIPITGGNPWRLLDYINLANEEDRHLLLVTAITCLVPGIAHAITIIHGEQGVAKSTAMRVLRRVLDPARQDLSTLSDSKKDLPIALFHNYVPMFDNLDHISPWQSDTLCRAVTGAGIAWRKLYSDEDEIILSFRRCPMLNGINLVATRPDLLDRAVIFNLERITEVNRREEAEFWASFERDRPEIVGGILDALAKAMRVYPGVILPGKPRMADYCRWGFAVGEALGIGGEAFLRAYKRNRETANVEAIAGNSVAIAVTALMSERTLWRGTMGELLVSLEAVAGKEKINTRGKDWPGAPQGLTRKLKSVTTNLRDAGIEYDVSRDAGNRSYMVLRRKSQKNSGVSGSPECTNGAEESFGDMLAEVIDISGVISGREPLITKEFGDTGDAGDLLAG